MGICCLLVLMKSRINEHAGLLTNYEVLALIKQEAHSNPKTPNVFQKQVILLMRLSPYTRKVVKYLTEVSPVHQKSSEDVQKDLKAMFFEFTVF